MELRTRLNIEPSADKITYSDKVMFIGSCFASSIGKQMEMGRMQVMINPAGTVFNPVSVLNTIDTIISEKEYLEGDLYYYDGNYISFNHYTSFSSEDPLITLEKINNNSKHALTFFKEAKFLFITFGTARVYRRKKSGKIVSNCHKLPQEEFISEILTVNDIVSSWVKELDRLHALYPRLKIVFTISPVRHWKDGAHGNQVSKSVLFLAIEELLAHPASPQYFPAYELVMDDLRDYRFYNDDMFHPSTAAINYIWEEFSACYLESKTLKIWKEVLGITRAFNHRLTGRSSERIKQFAEKMLTQISDLENKVPTIDLSQERDYFNSLLKRE